MSIKVCEFTQQNTWHVGVKNRKLIILQIKFKFCFLHGKHNPMKVSKYSLLLLLIKLPSRFYLNFTVQLSKCFLLVIDTTTCNKKVWSLLPSSLLCCFLDGGNLFFIVRRHMLRPKNYQHFSPKANAVLLWHKRRENRLKNGQIRSVNPLDL